MPVSLKEQITSQYFGAANALRPKQSRRRIVAYVESYDDIYFWRSILSQYEDDTRFFEVMLPSRRRLQRGKKSVLQHLSGAAMGQDMIACVDADYDYLLQGQGETSHTMLHNPYVLHTYAYSIENLQCYAPSLHNVCVMATLNDHSIFDFRQFFGRFSEIIFPLFVWSIHLYRTGEYRHFTITHFCSLLGTKNFRYWQQDQFLSRLSHKVQQQLRTLSNMLPGRKAQLEALQQEILSLGITPQSTYLYIQGHALFDTVVMPVLSSVCRQLRQEREAEISRQSIHKTQLSNELSCYQHSVQDIAAMLKKNTGYLLSPEVQLITNDLQHMLHG